MLKSMQASKCFDVRGIASRSYCVTRSPGTGRSSILQQYNEFTAPWQEKFWFVYTFFCFWSNISSFPVSPWTRRFLSDRTQQQKGTQRFLWLLSSFNIILWTVVVAVSNRSHCLLFCFYLSDSKPKLKVKLACLTYFILCKRTAYNS